ncbi:hypothetical protein BJ912DRAFT_1060753 [Pholiota molesta]|nr:hypothetical protein BJ912DRAFT_1060753 [Pholiota molesta]
MSKGPKANLSFGRPPSLSDALSTSEVISSGVAPAVASTSSAIASTSSSTSLTVDLPPRFSTSGNSESSQKRPGEDLQELQEAKERRQITAEGALHFRPRSRTPPPSSFHSSTSPSEGEPDETQKFKPHPLRGAILTLNDGTKLLLTELVFVQHALIGRAGDTTANGDITEDIDTMKVHEKPNHAWVIDHLPDVLHYEALELADDDVQSRLSKHLKSEKISYEDRVLQILVMTELFPSRVENFR